jgi:hypothetical protein
MKILITGMTSRMTSFSRESGFPSLLARSLHLFGHDVTMMVEYSGVDRYDAVFAGIASPLAPASTYLVPVAQTVDEASRQGKLAAVFLDDPDVRKIGHACSSALKRPERLQKPFYAARPGMKAFIEDDSLKATVMEFIERMSTWTWETVLWPGHPWAEDRVSGSGSGGFRSIPVDPTAALRAIIVKRWPDLLNVPGRGTAPGAPWIAESTYFHDHNFDPSMKRSVYDVMTGENVTRSAEMFALGYGILHGNDVSPGWWTPWPYIAALTERIYVPHPHESQLMGSPYHLLPHTLEDMDVVDYHFLATTQMNYHEEIACPRQQLHRTLSDVLGLLVS